MIKSAMGTGSTGLAAWMALALSAAAEGTATLNLAGFEPGQPGVVSLRGEPVRVVEDREKATEGSHCLRIEAGGTDTYNGFEVTEKTLLRPFRDYLLFKLDVFNPQAEPVVFGITMADSRSTSWGTKHNGSATAAPGKSTIEVNLTGLNRSNAKGNTSTDLVDPADIRLLNIFMMPSQTPVTLYIDNLRLEPSGLPTVEGLTAIDFGMKGSPVYPGFIACTQKDTWNDQAAFGWVNPGQADNCQIPDALTADFGSGEAFKLRLPNGRYEIQVCLDPFGLWGRLPSFTRRTVVLNGTQVLDESMDGATYLDKVYYAHEDQEDLPGQSLWDKFILPRNQVRTFEADVTDGVLTVEVKSPDKHGRWITFLVAYPEARKTEGRAWMAAVQAQRREKFDKKVVLQVAPPDGDEVVATAADQARGFVPFVRHSEGSLAVTARPAKDEIGTPIAIETARSQRCGAQLGLYPLAAVAGVSVETTDLVGDNGAMIPARALQIRKIRNFFKRPGRENIAVVLPHILQEFQTLDLQPGTTRGLWVTLMTPVDAKPGTYTGSVRLSAGGKELAAVPVRVTVWPFTLDKITDISMSVTGANSYPWRPWFSGLEDAWWKGGELVMQDLADHGMNCINGGPTASLTAIKDGKAVIDYADYDRWMDMAMKHGLDKMADGYGGLCVAGLPRDSGPDCIAVTEKDAQARFGMSFREVLRIVFAEFDQHNRDKGYPQRAYYILDEPRPEWGNVESAAELIKVYTSACPDTLFSGYLFPGGVRDQYFKTMPLVITQASRHTLKLTRDAGKLLWEYNGENVRHNIGRHCFVTRRAGLSGYLRNGYIFVCGDPYFDFSADEASWCVVYPSRKGLNGTCGWERTAEGVTDYRYLAMCERLIRKARAEGKAAASADAAEAFLSETIRPIDIDNNASAKLTPAQYDAFRRSLAGHIASLSAAVGEL